MSGFGLSSSTQSDYSYATAYQVPVPQYTQTQVNQYYLQYGCYPPQPHTVIPDFFPQQVAVTSAIYQPTVTSVSYDDASQWQDQTDYLQPLPPQLSIRSTSRGRTWTCDVADCPSSAKFTRLADLQRHQSTVHGVGKPSFSCTVTNCSRVGDKGFTRRDHLIEHIRNFHHIEVPKRKPGERSAFPFGYPEVFQNQ